MESVSVGSMSQETQSQLELPYEVITCIMDFLSLSDRISASQVCRGWYEASRDLKFLKHEVIKLEGDLPRLLNVFKHSSNRFLHFVFHEVELTANMDEFCDKFCPDMRSLSIENCDITERHFVDILKKCSNLQSLSLISCRELLISGRVLEIDNDIKLLRKTLVRLVELHLVSNRYLSDSLFNRFVSITPNLKSLSFSNCQISFHSGLYKRFYPNNFCVLQSDLSPPNLESVMLPSESILTFHNILCYIDLVAKNIKTLGFGGTLMDNIALNKLVEVPGLQLDVLRLHDCVQLAHKGILGITEHQQMLKVLDLSKCPRVVDLSLLSICNSLTNLTSLNLHCCRALTNASASQLWQLKHLEDLDLSYCDSVTSPGIEAGLCSRVNTSMRHLRLSGLSLGEETICLLTHNLPELVSLNLACCGSAVTDQSIQAICSNLVWLRVLKLKACDKITDAGLTGMGISNTSQHREDSEKSNPGNNAANLVDLSPPLKLVVEENNGHKISLRSKAEQDIVNDAKRKQMVSQMCEEQYLNLTETGQSLARLKGLRYLDLSLCNRITDVSLKFALHFTELQVLNISNCQQITQSGLSYIATNNPSIEELIMSHCYNVTDDGILYLLKNLPRLKVLDVQHCDQLTDQCLKAIGQYCQNLRHLNVSLCRGMSLEECDRVEALLPALHSFERQNIKSRCVPLFGQGSTPVNPKPPAIPRALRALLRR